MSETMQFHSEAELFMNSLCTSMPSIVSWNIRSLNHNDEDLRRRRVAYVRNLCDEYEVVCLQETHCTMGLLTGMLGLCAHTVHASTTDRPLAAGGVAVIVQSSRWRAGTSHILVPGRAMALQLIRVGKPEEGDADSTWDGVLTAVGQHVAQYEQRLIVAGDWNLDLD
eukprot:2875062-Amphidinium_carterae.1